jgi:hypothetical protein
VAGRDKLDFTKAPAIPFAPVEYDRGAMDTTHNILRQYFNTLDNVTGQLLSNGGGRFLSFPHISARDETDQYATATDTATKVLWDTLESGLDFTLNPNSTATPNDTGVYKIDYRLQFLNTANQIHEAFVWLEIDGVNVPGSGSIFSVPNSHGGVDGALVAYSSVTFAITGGEDIALYWATNLAATSGGGNGVYLHASPAQVSPFAMPSIPSAMGSIVFVSGVVP